jgi:eukaryotic-like serine/threonine-protein kinase
VADPAAVEAATIPFRAVEAEALHVLGRLRWKASDYTGAGDALKRAIWAAEESRLDELKTASAVALAVVSVDLSGFQAAHDWLAYASAALHRLGEPAELVIEERISTAMVLFRESHYKDSERAARDAIRIAERTFGGDDLRVAAAYRSLGDALNWQNRQEEALASFGHARALTAKTLGDGHPDVGVLLRKEADAYAMRKDGAGALERARQALEIFTASLPAGHLSIAQTHTNIAEALGLLGRHEEAIAEERLALGTYERIFGAESENVGVSSTNIGYSLMKLGHHAEARTQLQRAIRIYDKTLAPGSVEIAEPLLRLGELELAAKRPADAVAPLERALALRKNDADPTEMRDAIERALARARAR